MCCPVLPPSCTPIAHHAESLPPTLLPFLFFAVPLNQARSRDTLGALILAEKQSLKQYPTVFFCLKGVQRRKRFLARGNGCGRQQRGNNQFRVRSTPSLFAPPYSSLFHASTPSTSPSECSWIKTTRKKNEPGCWGWYSHSISYSPILWLHFHTCLHALRTLYTSVQPS